MIGNFIWGEGGKAITPEEAKQRRELARAMIAKGSDFSPVQHWTQGAARVANALAGAMQMNYVNQDENAAREASKASDAQFLGLIGSGGAPMPLTGAAAPSVGTAKPNEISNQFLDTVKANGIQNPVALAAIGATGERESGWSPKRINATWADPSESGQAGTSGGLMSWRADRLENLRKFAAAQGESGLGSPATQAKFFVAENPQLVQRLNAAKNSQEAMLAMNDAWRFAGYNRPGGERDARLQAAEAWAAKMGRAPEMAATPDAAAQMGRAPNIAPTPDMVMPAVGGAQQAPAPAAMPAPVQQVAQANPQLLQAAMARMNDPYASAGSRAVAQALVQRIISQQSQDPRDSQLKDLSIEEKKRNLGRVEMETMTAPDGTVFEREKGKPGAQWKESLKLPAKPENPLDVKSKELAIQKAQRELEGEGATPLTPEERTQIGIPEGQPAYKTRTGDIKFGPAGTKITNDQRQESEFGKETGKALAQRFNAMAMEGDEAVQNQAMIDELRKLGGRFNTGASAVLKDRLGQLGIKTEGVEEIQAFRSLVARLTPQQRVPGSGATSDFDAKMFQDSLPSLINQPGGNALILDTIDKLNANKVARGDIALRVQAGELKPNEAVGELRKLQAEARALSDSVKERMKGQGNTTPAPQNAPATSPANGGFRILKVE